MSGYTTTPNLSLKMPVSGADDNLWGTHWNQNALALDSSVLPLSGGTLDPGPLAIGTGTGTPTLTFNGASGNNTGVQWQTAGTNRWRFIADASDNLGLFAYDAAGAYKGTMLLAANAGDALQINCQPQITFSTATPFQQTVGLYQVATNTGAAPAQGAKFGYFSSAGNTGFDTGLTNIAIFDPTFIGGQTPFYQSVWLVAVSPNDTTHGWSTIIGELNITNRGNDTGWMRDRTLATNTGGFLFVPEAATFGGTGGGEGKNATFAMSVSHSGANNSTGFPVKFYNGLLFEPNAIVGQTGRAIYATGDITGTGSQYPYGPLQTDGTWLHGIDHTKAVYTDAHAMTMLQGQALAWITGTTPSPTAVASVTAVGSGANISLQLIPAGTGNVAITSAAVVGGGLTVGTSAVSGTQINVYGASTTSPGVSWFGGTSQRWKFATDAAPEGGGNSGANLTLYSYDNAGGFLQTVMTLVRSNGVLVANNGLQSQTGIGVFGTAPVTTKPTVTGAKGGNAALTSLLTALAAYGLVTDSTTA